MTKFIFLFLISSAAFAESLNCYDFALNSNRNLTSAEAINLCKGTVNTTALYCFDITASRELSQTDRVNLCKGARDISVITCFDNSANRANLTLADRIELCSQR